MAAPLQLVLLWTIAIALLKNQEAKGNNTNDLHQNNTDKLDEMIAIMTRMEEFLQLQQRKQDQLILTTVQTHQNTVTQIANIQSQSLNQMISVFEIQNQHLDNISSILPHLVSLLEKHQDKSQLSSTPVIVEATAPITQPPSIPIDCSDISAPDDQGSGVYTIDPRDGLGSFQVYCNMDIDGGGWTVFQKRFDGSVDFFLGWRNYEEGFGNVQGEHWLGLKQLHRMTSSGQWKLRINMEDFNGYSGYAQYEDFQIGNAASFYQLSIGAYSGTAGNDALSYHNGQPFSTKDSDHDTCTNCQSYDGSCALRFQGAWWYDDCIHSNLNALYQGSSSPVPNNPTLSLMTWYRFSGSGRWPTIKKSEMKMRRVQ